jgi:hypothetical protein
METVSTKQYAEELVKSLLNKEPHGNLYTDLHYAKENALKIVADDIANNNGSIAFLSQVMSEITNIKNL